jgi:hypothetical protein
MGPYILYGPGNVPSATTCLQVQETQLALLPLRSLLLRDDLELHLPLVSAFQRRSIRRVLLSFAWVTSQRCHNVAE